jgi:hypothetical protein
MTAETIKIYNGGDPKIAEAVCQLETFIGDMENLELADDSTVYAPEAVAALNVLIERLNRSEL